MRRETAMQAESDKERLVDSVPMWETPLVLPHFRSRGREARNFSENESRLKGVLQPELAAPQLQK